MSSACGALLGWASQFGPGKASTLSRLVAWHRYWRRTQRRKTPLRHRGTGERWLCAVVPPWRISLPIRPSVEGSSSVTNKTAASATPRRPRRGRRNRRTSISNRSSSSCWSVAQCCSKKSAQSSGAGAQTRGGHADIWRRRVHADHPKLLAMLPRSRPPRARPDLLTAYRDRLLNRGIVRADVTTAMALTGRRRHSAIARGDRPDRAPATKVDP
jgi:hypothetical protein